MSILTNIGAIVAVFRHTNFGFPFQPKLYKILPQFYPRHPRNLRAKTTWFGLCVGSVFLSYIKKDKIKICLLAPMREWGILKCVLYNGNISWLREKIIPVFITIRYRALVFAQIRPGSKYRLIHDFWYFSLYFSLQLFNKTLARVLK